MGAGVIALLLVVLSAAPAPACQVDGLGPVTLDEGLSCAVLRENFRLAKLTVLRRGWATPAQLRKAWEKVPVRVEAKEKVDCGGELSRGCFDGAAGVTLSQDGGSLLHELLHALEWRIYARVTSSGAEGHGGWMERGWMEAGWDYSDAAEPLK